MIRFSFFLPVYNGGRYLKDCVHAILSQDYPYFILHILENFSNDGTREWLNQLSDERVVVDASDRLLTIEENWSRILHVPKNEYMTVIGHDDILKPDFLSSINCLIERFPMASLYHTHFNFIDADGNEIRKCRRMSTGSGSTDYLEKVLVNGMDIVGTGFVFRSADFDRMGGMPSHYPGLLFADYELWIRLASLSFMAVSEKEMFSFRLHLSTTSTSSNSRMLQAFEVFIRFLKGLSRENKDLDAIIRNHAVQFMRFYCKGFSHRLLKTPAGVRGDLTVVEIIQFCQKQLGLLDPGIPAEKINTGSLLLAKWIDRSRLTRQLFLFYQRYFRPVRR